MSLPRERKVRLFGGAESSMTRRGSESAIDELLNQHLVIWGWGLTLAESPFTLLHVASAR